MEHSHNQNKLLSYASLQAVLTHLDPNLRIYLSLRCSSSKNVEKAVPLKCRTLELNANGYSTRINEVTYDVLKYDSGKAILDFVNTLKSKGAFIDENGRRDCSATKLIMSEDKVICIHVVDRAGPAKLLFGLAQPGSSMVICKLSATENDDKQSEGFKAYLKFVLNKFRKRESFQFSREDIINSCDYLNHFIFGNRSCPIQVKMLKYSGSWLDLPENGQFHFRELDAEYIKGLELEPHLKPSRLPLDHVVVYGLYPETVLHPMIQNAHSVHFNETNELDDFYQILISLNYKKITSDRKILKPEYADLIKKWRKDTPDIGTSVTFQLLFTSEVESIFKIILNTFHYRENEEGHLFISLNGSSDVRISAGDDLSESARKMMRGMSNETEFNYLKLEVVATGHMME